MLKWIKGFMGGAVGALFALMGCVALGILVGAFIFPIVLMWRLALGWAL